MNDYRKNFTPRNLLRSLAVLCACAVLHCSGEGALPAGLEIPVPPAEAPAQIALSPSNAQIARGTAQQFTVRGLYEDGHAQDLTGAVTWTVEDERGGSLPMPTDGLLQLDAPGRYTVTATHAGVRRSTPIIVTLATLSSVSINPVAPRIAKGLTQPFTATASFSDGSTQDVTRSATWAVRDVVGTGVATIDTTGIMLAKSVGKATISARFMTQSASTTAEIVEASLTNLIVSPPDPVIANGNNQGFTATGTFSDGTISDLTSRVTWAVTDLVGTRVAAIDGTGTANGTSVGQARITAEYGALTGETTLTVTPATAVGLTITPSSTSFPKGLTKKFTAIAKLTDGSTQDVSTMAVWTSADRSGTGVASVDGTGLARGNSMGSALVSATYRGFTATALAEVTSAVLTNVNVTPATTTVYAGSYFPLVAVGFYSDGSTQDVTVMTSWSTVDVSGTDVLSVVAGRVFGKSLGVAKVTGTFGGFSASSTVTVSPPTYTGLTVSVDLGLAFAGMQLQMTALGKLPDGTTQNVTKATRWTSGSTATATVDSNGVVTTRAAGLVRITGTFNGFTASTVIFVVS